MLSVLLVDGKRRSLLMEMSAFGVPIIPNDVSRDEVSLFFEINDELGQHQLMSIDGSESEEVVSGSIFAKTGSSIVLVGRYSISLFVVPLPKISELIAELE